MKKLSNTDAIRAMPRTERRYVSPMAPSRRFMDTMMGEEPAPARPTGPNETRESLRDAITWMKDSER